MAPDLAVVEEKSCGNIRTGLRGILPGKKTRGASCSSHAPSASLDRWNGETACTYPECASRIAALRPAEVSSFPRRSLVLSHPKHLALNPEFRPSDETSSFASLLISFKTSPGSALPCASFRKARRPRDRRSADRELAMAVAAVWGTGVQGYRGTGVYGFTGLGV